MSTNARVQAGLPPVAVDLQCTLSSINNRTRSNLFMARFFFFSNRLIDHRLARSGGPTVVGNACAPSNSLVCLPSPTAAPSRRKYSKRLHQQTARSFDFCTRTVCGVKFATVRILTLHPPPVIRYLVPIFWLHPSARQVNLSTLFLGGAWPNCFNYFSTCVFEMAVLHLLLALVALCPPAMGQPPGKAKAPPGMRSPGQMKMYYGALAYVAPDLALGCVAQA